MEIEAKQGFFPRIKKAFEPIPQLPAVSGWLYPAADILTPIEKPHPFSREDVSKYVAEKVELFKEKRKSDLINEICTTIALSQYRAIDYLYGKGPEAICKEGDPLVDILTLITYPRHYGYLSDYQLGVEGKPAPLPILNPFYNHAEKPEQRIFFETPKGKKEFRTITSFTDHISTSIRGLYILGEASRHHPALLASALNEYVETVPQKEGNVYGMAIGLLEVMHNAHVLYDPRFNSLASQLRDFVLAKTGSYKELKKVYYYSVTREKPFWYQGELQLERNRNKVKYVPAKGSLSELHYRAPEIRIPAFSDWQNNCRVRNELKRQIDVLTTIHSLKSSSMGFTPDKAISQILKDRTMRGSLAEELSSLEQKQREKLYKSWERFFEEEITEDIVIEESEIKMAEEIIKDFITCFINDASLSQKSRTNFMKIITGQDNEGGFYRIKTEKLLESPIFNWILAMRNPDTKTAFREAVLKDPSSFQLLLKLMVFEVARISFYKKELDFLYDPEFKRKMEDEDVMIHLDAILSKISAHIPDSRQLVKKILEQGDGRISDLLTPKKLKILKEDMEDLIYRKILHIPLNIRKAKGFAEADKKLLKKLSKIPVYLLEALLIVEFAGKGLDEIGKIMKTDAQKHAQDAQPDNQEPSQFEKDIVNFIENARKFLGIDNIDLFPNIKSGLTAAQDTFPDKVSERLPDAIDSQEKNQPFVFGKVYHLPVGSNFENGSIVGFFPADTSFKINETVNIVLTDWIKQNGLEFLMNPAFAINTPDIDKYLIDSDYHFENDQLVYTLENVPNAIYPPIGYMIVGVIQEGGSDPRRGPLSEIYYDNGQTPQKVMLITRPLNLKYVDSGLGRVQIDYDTGIKPFINYEKYFDPGLAFNLNYELRKDPALQGIHNSFYAEWKSNLDAGVTDPEIFSQIIEKYAGLYAQYTYQNRFYDLNFQIDKKAINSNGKNLTNYDALISIANQPDKGYFCSVASFAFRDFIASAGILGGIQLGMHIFNYDGYLIGGIVDAHQNNVVLLPDGRMLEVDMTPNGGGIPGGKVSDTDIAKLLKQQKDADAAQEKKIADEIEKKKMQEEKDKQDAINAIKTAKIMNEIGDIVLDTTIGVGAATIGYLGLYAVYSIAKRRIIGKRIEDSLAMDRDLTPLEKEIIVSAAGHISILSYDKNFPEKVAGLFRYIEDFDKEKHENSLRWINEVNEGQKLLGSSSAENAFIQLCAIVKDGNSYLKDEVRRTFPTPVNDAIAKYNKGQTDVEIPGDFRTIFGLSKILYQKGFFDLAKDIFTKLGLEGANPEKISIKYKIDDVLGVLEEKYASKKTPNTVKPLFNTIYRILRGKSEDTSN